MGNPVLFHMRVECPIPHASIFTLCIFTLPHTPVSRGKNRKAPFCGKALCFMAAPIVALLSSWCPLAILFSTLHWNYNLYSITFNLFKDKLKFGFSSLLAYESITIMILQLLWYFSIFQKQINLFLDGFVEIYAVSQFTFFRTYTCYLHKCVHADKYDKVQCNMSTWMVYFPPRVKQGAHTSK